LAGADGFCAGWTSPAVPFEHAAGAAIGLFVCLLAERTKTRVPGGFDWIRDFRGWSCFLLAGDPADVGGMDPRGDRTIPQSLATTGRDASVESEYRLAEPHPELPAGDPISYLSVHGIGRYSPPMAGEGKLEERISFPGKYLPGSLIVDFAPCTCLGFSWDQSANVRRPREELLHILFPCIHCVLCQPWAHSDGCLDFELGQAGAILEKVPDPAYNPGIRSRHRI